MPNGQLKRRPLRETTEELAQSVFANQLAGQCPQHEATRATFVGQSDCLAAMQVGANGRGQEHCPIHMIAHMGGVDEAASASVDQAVVLVGAIAFAAVDLKHDHAAVIAMGAEILGANDIVAVEKALTSSTLARASS